MHPPIVAIRPEPGLSQTTERASECGLTVSGYPLFEVRPVAWSVPDDRAFDALLLGSANAIRHGGPQLAMLLDNPVYAVGETTARTARNAGFKIGGVGAGGLQTLLDSLAHKEIGFLRLSGRDHVDLTLPRSHSIVDRIVYEARPVSIPKPMATILRDRAIVLLHSAVAAEHFAIECSRLAVQKSNIRIAALGPRIAEAAGEGWEQVAVAGRPSDAALLALAENLCK
ncbi:uroporphyrinogen-III synthase [Pontixanthobacter aestiaquae]|uniref:Uroporphyrinogen-III synthase n=1 Tax=Pontixanthobacter aestiaquae TaxID=1509367 RepID=A0A844ZEJ8_9SPHN|nr:uroporphyrinogen-III synthase [Pontixanthobacter aestiaquae]MDN3644816.1 uroporphyrinogen-III synthase [Pontixanthobacter aestiaquae]MXO84179.1 uroporphyrinogen-III synthase [Pontixanthobacter aestiaquae]